MSTRRWARASFRIATAITELLLLFAGLQVILTETANPVPNLLFWNLVAFTYLGVGFLVVRRQLRQHKVRSQGQNPSNASPSAVQVSVSSHIEAPVLRKITELYWTALPLVLSVLGLTAALTILFGETLGASNPDSTIIKVTAALVVISTWLMLQVSYARRYQWIAAREGSGIVFPGTSHPTQIDYLYFAFTLGSSFATSDANITSTTMRWHVLIHSVLSFFYNAIVLAVGFRIFTGG